MRLKNSEWAFHKIKESELPAAWRWEIEREAGSGCKPWRDLSPELRRKCADYCNPLVGFGFRELPIDTATKQRLDLYQDMTTLSAHFIELNHQRSKTEVLKAVKDWLDSMSWGIGEKGGRRNDHKAWLVDLVIYRAGKAGLTRPQARKQFACVFEWSGIVENTNGSNKFSESHWSDAKARTQSKIDEISAQRFRLSSAFQ